MINLEQISRDQYVLTKFTVAKLSDLQVVKNGAGKHCLTFGDASSSSSRNSNANQQKMLDLSEMFGKNYLFSYF